jgi:hypothetical protein
MQMASEILPETQDLTQRVDLSAIAEANPVNRKTAVLDLNTFDATQLTLLEVLDMAETAGAEPVELGKLMAGRNNAKRMRLLYAMAWCIARRANPALTFEEVCTWKLEVIGEVKPERTERLRKRAAIVVGAAEASGLSPEEAGDLTIAQLSAYTANRAARRRRSKR